MAVHTPNNDFSNLLQYRCPPLLTRNRYYFHISTELVSYPFFLSAAGPLWLPAVPAAVPVRRAAGSGRPADNCTNWSSACLRSSGKMSVSDTRNLESFIWCAAARPAGEITVERKLNYRTTNRRARPRTINIVLTNS